MGIKIKRIIELVYYAISIVLMADIVIGANGRYFEFSLFSISISPRFVITALFFLIFLFRFFTNGDGFRKNIIFNPIIILFITLLVISTVSFAFGYITNGFSNSFSDYKTFLLIFAVFPYLDLWINRVYKPKTIFKWFKLFAYITAFAVVGFQICTIVWGIKNGYDYDRVAHDLNTFFTNKYPDFAIGFRRPYGVYYDGLFFVSILFCLELSELLFKRNIKHKLIKVLSITFLGYSVLQSQTRGFLIVMFLASLFIVVMKIVLYFRDKKRNGYSIRTQLIVISICSFLFLVITVSLFYFLFGNTRLFNFDDKSTEVRLQFIKETFEVCFKPSIILGKGLGYQLASKGQVHLEISLLEIFLKQGLLGLIIWLLPIFYFVLMVKRRNFHFIEMLPPTIFISFVYLVSFFNPHLFDLAGVTILAFSLSFVWYLKIPVLTEIKSDIKIAYLCFNNDYVMSFDYGFFIDPSIYGNLTFFPFLKRLMNDLKRKGYDYCVFCSNNNLCEMNTFIAGILSEDKNHANSNILLQGNKTDVYVFSVQLFDILFDNYRIPSKLSSLYDLFILTSNHTFFIKKNTACDAYSFEDRIFSLFDSSLARLYAPYDLFCSIDTLKYGKKWHNKAGSKKIRRSDKKMYSPIENTKYYQGNNGFFSISI